MEYDYTFLEETLVRIKNLGIEGEKILEEDDVDTETLERSVNALKNIIDEDIFNENSSLGKTMKDYLVSEHRRLARWKLRIDKARNNNVNK